MAHSFAQNERFGDEVGHFVGGHYVLEGKTLYRDLQFNHQPLVYIFSAVTERVTEPSNLYFYISRQREAVFVYAALWILLMFGILGRRSVFFAAIFLPIVYLMSGYKLLGETLSIFPAVFVMAMLWKSYVFKENFGLIEIAVTSISLFLVMFSLLPQWPFVAFAGIALLLYVLKDRVKVASLIVPFLVLSGILFTFVPITDYIRETFTYNTQYLLPNIDRSNSIVNVVTYPFLSLIPPYKSAQVIIATLVLMYIVYLYIFSKKAKWKLAVPVIALFLMNIRIEPGSYNSFHTLPWFGALLMSVIMMTFHSFLKNKKQIYIGYRAQLLIIIVAIVYLFNVIPNPVQAKRNALSTYGNTYGESESIGRAIKVMKSDTDTLLVVHNDPIIYYVADIEPATSVLEYYSWVYKVPKYRQEIIDTFATKPPAYVVDTGLSASYVPEGTLEEDISIDQIMLSQLAENYIRLYHVDKESMLYVHKDKIERLTDSQVSDLNELIFSIPE